ncbi:hypothetical protein BDR06DRAFT_687688 [Suillus hirtellus]|nr:hypothetical protein BDR06DRAFT_687688 [Suillus hirtellus]
MSLHLLQHNGCIQAEASCSTSLSLYVVYRENLQLRLRRSHNLQELSGVRCFNILLDVQHGRGRFRRDCGCLSSGCRDAPVRHKPHSPPPLR